MILEVSVRTESIVLVIGIFGLAWSDAIAQYDGTRGCESFANAFYKKKDPGFRDCLRSTKIPLKRLHSKTVSVRNMSQAIFRGLGKYVSRRMII
jgi:hypothetical protein